MSGKRNWQTFHCAADSSRKWVWSDVHGHPGTDTVRDKVQSEAAHLNAVNAAMDKEDEAKQHENMLNFSST